jgi:porin
VRLQEPAFGPFWVMWRAVEVSTLMSMRYLLVGVAILAMFLGAAPASVGQEVEEDETPSSSEPSRDEVPQFGGPSSVGGQLNEDQQGRELLSWRERLAEKGFSFGVSLSSLYQGASNSLGEDEAAGGIFQIPISWTLQEGEHSTGTLVVKGEWRGRLGTDLAPQDLGFAVGAASITGTQFSNMQWAVTNFYWQQRLNDGRISFNLGRVDATDYLDVYGLINPQTSFQNLVFLTNPSIASPNPGLGGALGAMLGEQWYVLGGFSDANALPTETGFDSFDGGELFKHIEIGWTPSQDRLYLDNVHLTLWHTDERPEAGVSRGSGAAFTIARFLNDKLMPFLRIGVSDGGAGALQESSVATGIGWYRPDRDLLGFGLAWGEPSEDGFGPVSDQFTAEFFYRWQATPVFAVTGDVQLITDPALNPDESQVVVVGLRARLSL